MWPHVFHTWWLHLSFPVGLFLCFHLPEKVCLLKQWRHGAMVGLGDSWLNCNVRTSSVVQQPTTLLWWHAYTLTHIQIMLYTYCAHAAMCMYLKQKWVRPTTVTKGWDLAVKWTLSMFTCSVKELYLGYLTGPCQLVSLSRYTNTKESLVKWWKFDQLGFGGWQCSYVKPLNHSSVLHLIECVGLYAVLDKNTGCHCFLCIKAFVFPPTRKSIIPV